PDAGSRLLIDDLIKSQRASEENDAKQAKAEGDFIGNELGTGAESAEEAVFVIAGPAAENNPVHRDARKGKDINHSDVEARSNQKWDRILKTFDAKRWEDAAEGNGRENCNRGRHDHNRRETEKALVDVAGGELFFENELKAVGHRLAQAEHFYIC